MTEQKSTVTLEEIQHVRKRTLRSATHPRSDSSESSGSSLNLDAVSPGSSRRKRSLWKWIVLGLVILILLAIGIFALGIYAFAWTDPVTKAVTTTLPYPAARVGSSWITMAEYQESLNAARFSNDAKKAQGVDASQIYTDEETQNAVYDALIRNATVEELAAQNDVSITQAEVDEAFTQLSKAADSDVTIAIKDLFNWTPEQYKENIFRPLLLEQKLGEKIQSDPATKEPARKQAEDLLTRIRNGEDFATLAQENSDDGSAALGGDLGYFGKGQMVQSFEDASFALEVGQVSEIVETQYGYHVIKLDDRRVGEAEDGGDLIRARHILIRPVVFEDWFSEHEASISSWKPLKLPPLPGQA